jgi:hypothetical protein
MPEGKQLELIHPIYLDIPMMVSFFAALEGGISFESEITDKVISAQTRQREGSGKVGLPSLASLLGLSIDMTGRIRSDKQAEESSETKVVREHTEASLFNLLRESLKDSEDFMEVLDVNQLGQVYVGQLIEISGEIGGNPLQRMLNAIFQFLPYVGIDVEALSRPSTDRSRSKGQAQRGMPSRQADESGLDRKMLGLLQIMRSDLEKAQVQDLVLKSSGEMRVVLTMAKEFMKRETEEYLLAGKFTAIGKVTRVLQEGERINLMRRSALGLAGQATARAFINSFQEGLTSSEEYGVNAEDDLADEISEEVSEKSTDNLVFETDDPIVEPPALQLLPLAIFI